jgi:hypothetical protein
MTAIFVVMNNKGLAIAADSAQSTVITDEKGHSSTVSTEQVSKIYRQEKFNFVVASAGAETINSIPIEGILNRWVSNLEKSPSLSDYVESFIRWLAEESCLEDAHPESSYLVFQIRNQFRTLRETLEEDKSRDVSATISNLYDQWETIDAPNIYGFSEQKIVPAYSKDKGPELFTNFTSRFLDYRLREDLDESYLKQVNDAFNIAYEIELEPTKLLNNNEMELLKQKSLKFNIDFNDDAEPQAKLMFAGYGENDWLPSVISLSVFNFDTLLPRISVKRIANPRTKWYMAVAVNDAVSKYFNPVDANVETELRSKLSERFKGKNYLKAILEVFDEVVSGHDQDYVGPIREKVNFLSVDDLGFIARQMVAMESFNSFVFQYLPEVGGQIEVVKITRNEFKDLTDRD